MAEGPILEQMAAAIARSMPGWNEDTDDGPLTSHWEKVNQTCLSMARGYASAALEAIANTADECHRCGVVQPPPRPGSDGHDAGSNRG
ncbi:hypothetical protein [Agromyces humi]|uniref:hypothetical protein n=1 Tax=Agromyces humi TaxID=1766800 RepID=UPI001356F567|nr:hypothetical protein [Agromyces humi]